MIRTLQTYRGIFVFMIFLSHFTISGHSAFEPGGDVGVAFFFMLSGLVMRMKYRNQKIDCLKFLKRRLIKIYPIHLLCLAIACIIGWSGTRLLILDGLLLQSWIPNNAVNFSLNGVAWYLSTLIFLYVLFPSINSIYSSRLKRLYACGFLILISIYVGLEPLIRENTVSYWLYVFPPSRIFDFVLGMFLADFVSFLRIKSETSRYKSVILGNSLSSLIVVLAWGMLSVFILFVNDVEYCYQLGAWWWLPNALILIVSTFYGNTPLLINKIIGCTPLVWFGNISLSFFLTHVLMIRITEILERHLGLDFSWPTQLLIVFVSTLVVSYLLEKYIVNLFSAPNKTR